MKRVQEKIKDLVEAQALAELQNHAGNPARALASYFFTDATSDLFARWLDALAELSHNQGTARALAGLRGVGKSHMLAAFGALAALPDLRSSIKDAHVAASARRLLSYRYKVAHVERGTRPTLQEELSAALGGDLETWKKEPSKMLSFAASMSDTPLLLIVDTAFEREARVERDDGALLGELASAAKLQNIFIALALDDDIASADGANVSLSGEFQIDYLDPEHLYRITDVHLFQKNDQSRAALREMHTTLRTLVPGFNWSEPRFSAIYPMHPLIAEIASAVRQYVPTFAFLPFASAAGAHAVNRPSLSLVVLDEVFDRTEQDLRRAEKLKAALAAYDHLAKHAVAQIPIMQRLQAKLLLKGLFILSLDGRGATARELGAAMLLYDEQQPDAAIERIANMLDTFAEAAPPGSLLKTVDESDARYHFSIDLPEGIGQTSIVAPESVAEEASVEETATASAPTPAVTMSDQELARWASLLTERSLPASIASEDARDAARASLAEWQKAWRTESPLKDFDMLPDEGLTTRIWNLSAAVRKAFNHTADAIEATLAHTISLEEGLERVASSFNNAPEQLARSREQLAQLKSFVQGLPERERARAYLSLAEPTNVDEIESARRELLAIAEDVHNLLDAESVERFNLLWHEFHTRYSEYYVKLHDETLHDSSRLQAIEEMTHTPAWREFESLSQLQIVNRRYWEEANALLERARVSECELPAREMLKEHAICACRFRLTMANALARLPQDLSELIELGLAAHRRTLLFLSTPLAIALDALARKSGDDEMASRARSLSGAFAQGTGPAHFNAADVRLIENALERMTTPPPVRLRLPVSDYGLLTRDELRARLNQWLDDLPNEPALVEVVERDGNDGG